jgi:hypothetical protein
MEVNGDKKSTRIPSCFSPVFFNTVSKLVQALLVANDEIFQTLSEGDVLLPKPFLYFGFDGVTRCKSPAAGDVFQFAKHVKVQGGRVGAVLWVGWGPELASAAGRLILSPGLGESHSTLRRVPEQVWKLC